MPIKKDFVWAGLPRKEKCEGRNCLGDFIVEWPGMRRCKKCRKNKTPYKDKNSPF